MPSRVFVPPALGLTVLSLLIAAGCSVGNGRLLSELRLSSAVVTPGAQGESPAIFGYYGLSRPATVSAYLAPTSGGDLYLSKDELRPVAGDYALRFDGTYPPDMQGSERRVIPAGSYRLVLEATDAAGQRESAFAQLQVRDSETTMPTIENFNLHPSAITPNADDVDDITKITYRTVKPATVTIYIYSDSGKRYVLERQERLAQGEHGTTWNGQIGDQLVRPGDYAVVAEAQDAAGNVAVARSSLRVSASSVPDVHLLSVDFQPKRILSGGTVKVEIRVRNTGDTVLRSEGPDPGYSYNSRDSFSSIAGGAYRDEPGCWRVGVDWTDGPAATGSKYPFRWGFGKDLQPGEEVTVEGYIRMEQQLPRISLYAGLVQENVRYWDDEVGRTTIEIDN